MKKTMLFILVAILAMSFCLHASAEEVHNDMITIDAVDIIFDAESSLTYEEKQMVAEYLVNGDPGVQTYGLLCTLFGHKESTEIVITVTHRVRDSVPRCLDEEWELIICTRCETIIEETRLSYYYVDCCPED